MPFLDVCDSLPAVTVLPSEFLYFNLIPLIYYETIYYIWNNTIYMEFNEI